MHLFIVILHVIVAVALILIVLLQTGKGASMGAAFGAGSSGTVFGSRGPAGFLSKITAFAAIVFMMTSLALGIVGKSRVGGDSIMDGVKPPAAQEETAAGGAAEGAQAPAEEPKPAGDQAESGGGAE